MRQRLQRAAFGLARKVWPEWTPEERLMALRGKAGEINGGRESVSALSDGQARALVTWLNVKANGHLRQWREE